MIDHARVRRMMVDNQLRTYDITDLGVLSAMNAVPREVFAPADAASVVYADQPLAVARGADGEARQLLPPMIFARMVQHLELRDGDTLLIVAGALGYEAAVAARLGAKVVVAEPDAALAAATRDNLAAVGADGVEVVEKAYDARIAGDDGFPAILINGAVQRRPDELLGQLCEGGRLVAVVGDGGRTSRATLFVRNGDVFGARPLFDAAAPALAAFREEAGFVF
ncbi:MAG: protein-L-isoaspartate O-methyltransferase [Salinarimonadaceae bacterium]|nr:MAG: protein-L-isoaspartate O-methyltransferase [Salinarimonadaceae bacterium]